MDESPGLHILYVGRDARVGGGSTFRLNIARGLLPRGHRVWVAAWPGGMVPRYRAAGVGYVWTPPPPWSGPWLARAIRRHRIDVVHSSNITPSRAAAWACRRTGAPLVVSIHALLNRREAHHRCLREAPLVLCFDDCAEQRLRKHRDLLDPAKIVTLPRPIEHRPQPPSEEPPFRVVYIGRLSQRKGRLALMVLEAFQQFVRRVPDAELTIVGDGTRLREARRRAREDARGAGRERIRVAGAAVDPLPIVAGAHVVVGAGYAALEALMRGTAVIGAGFRGYGLVDAENVLDARGCNFGDSGERWTMTPASFVAALEQLHAAWRSPAERERYWGLDRLLAPVHSLEIVAPRIERLYRETLGTPLPVAP